MVDGVKLNHELSVLFKQNLIFAALNLGVPNEVLGLGRGRWWLHSQCFINALLQIIKLHDSVIGQFIRRSELNFL